MIKTTHEEDRIENDAIFLDSEGNFPKRLIIVEETKNLEYKILKTRKGKYQLVK
ncbi:MAG: hypothetical protein SRB2_02131 [Desulfobacteraceae bacterium Eth-SRB2]|nr:MAG: hypothetical protein SRB2_02131 [Desulfobacteraceae bacterium Eth-SRB2]